eukprot:6451250-Alexandrium_andersonii.AAC.1
MLRSAVPGSTSSSSPEALKLTPRCRNSGSCAQEGSSTRLRSSRCLRSLRRHTPTRRAPLRRPRRARTDGPPENGPPSAT